MNLQKIFNTFASHMNTPPHITYDAFKQLFTEHRKKFERLAYFQTGNSEESKDIVSRCFLSLWERRDALRENELLSYMFIAVRNACMDYRRASTRHQKVYENILKTERGVMEYYSRAIESCDPSQIFTDEITDILRKTLQDLPAPQRQIFVMSRVEGKTYNEIAQELGLTYKQVDKSLQKTMKVLRQSLGEYLPLALILLAASQY